MAEINYTYLSDAIDSATNAYDACDDYKGLMSDDTYFVDGGDWSSRQSDVDEVKTKNGNIKDIKASDFETAENKIKNGPTF